MTDAALPYPSLLPLRAAEIELRFTQPSRPSFFHQPALTAFVRHLLGSPDGYDLRLTVDAPESGRTAYRAGDRYRFVLLALSGGESLLDEALKRLTQLPGSAPVTDQPAPFRDNLELVGIRDHFTGRPAHRLTDLTVYGPSHLQQEVQRWVGTPQLNLRLLSPALLRRRDHARRKSLDRFCRGRGDLDGALFHARVCDALSDLSRRRGFDTEEARGATVAAELTSSDLFWVDGKYSGADHGEKFLGGMLGSLALRLGTDFGMGDWAAWVLGQYVGIGSYRAFGFGRYRLETPDAQSPTRLALPAHSLLQQIATPENFALAYAAIRDNLRNRKSAPQSAPESEDESPDDNAALDDEAPQDRIERTLRALLGGRYRPPDHLQGWLIPKKDGGVRPLATPPFWDRVVQRAFSQVLAAALEPIMSSGSFGYRAGRSRAGARDLISKAYADGYRWAYKADVEDFFDTVDWTRLERRLSAVFRLDPMIDLLMSWMRLPVQYQGRVIQRSAGLPQGSPLSSVMANLMLDDFDSDLEVAGLRFARYADDFIVLCRTREQAEHAAEVCQASLAEHGLELNPDKSSIRSFEQGFKHLGYLHVRSLALDAAGKNPPRTGPGPMPPSRSWYAEYLRQVPHAVVAAFAVPVAEPAENIPEVPAVPPQKTQAASPAPNNEPLPAVVVGDEKEPTLLIVAGEHASLKTSAGRIEVFRDDTQVHSGALVSLRAILLIGAHQISSAAIRASMEAGVPVHFSSGSGRYLGVAASGNPGSTGPSLWLLQQQRTGDEAIRLRIAKALVGARIHNMWEVLRLRDAADDQRPLLDQLKRHAEMAQRCETASSLNGVEGTATSTYFEGLRAYVPDGFGFDHRSRQPPRDPFNALLSFGYTVLQAHVDSLLRADGLYPWIGVYHTARSGHATLASDFQEPFRHVIERAALHACGPKGGLHPADFSPDSGGGIRIQQEARRRYVTILRQRFATECGSRSDHTPRSIYDQVHRQNLSFVRWLHKDAEPFHPFVML